MAGEFDISWGNLDEYFVEEVETSRFPKISEVDLGKMRDGYQNKNTKWSTSIFLTTGEYARGVLEDIPVEKLDAGLCKFHAEVRRKDGEE